MSRKLKLKKIGDGSEDNPFRPDINSVPEIAELNKILNKYRDRNKEFKNITFYIIHSTYNEELDEFEIELILSGLPYDIPDDVKLAHEKLKKVLKA